MNIYENESHYKNIGVRNMSVKIDDSIHKAVLKYRLDNKFSNVTITEYLGNSLAYKIPEVLEEKQVTKIEKYAFHEHRELEEVSIPKGVIEIGEHSFYNCRNLLKVIMPDSIRSFGDGAFKNCEKLHTIEINSIHNQMFSLKGILAELNQEVIVTIHYEDGDAVLVFPYYMHSFEENTPARIVTQVTVGSGVHYRECVYREDVLYNEYDKIFSAEKNIDVTESAYKIALNRLAYPYGLSEKKRQEYYKYIYENRMKLVDNLLRKEYNDMLQKLLKLDVLNRADMETVIEMARNYGVMQGLTVLLQYHKEKYGIKNKTFEF